MIKKKHAMGIILALVMICAALSAVDTVSAAKYKKIDSGKYKEDSGVLDKYTTYYNGKTVKISFNGYAKNKKTKKYTKYLGNVKYYLTKTSKKKLKVVKVSKLKGTPSQKETSYDITSLSAKKYYYKKLKPGMK